MKKQLSSLDIAYLARELKFLEGARVDNIYHSKEGIMELHFYVRNHGKEVLYIEAGKCMHLSKAKKGFEEPSGFCMMLRKAIGNMVLKEIKQIEPERIVEFIFGKGDEKGRLIAELLSKGTIVFADERGKILNASVFTEFSTRKIKKGEIYKHPVMEHNFFSLSEDEIKGAFSKTNKESIVKSIAIDFGLGGAYSEEVCLLSGVDKNKAPKEAKINEISAIKGSIKKILDKKAKPAIYSKDGVYEDAAPFELEFYKGFEKKEFETFSQALEEYFSKFSAVKKGRYEKEIENLQRIIEEQKEKIKEYEKEEKEFQSKGELIYNNYQLVEGIIKEINKAAEKYSWQEIKEKLKGHKSIKEIDIKDKKVVVEIN